MSTLISEATIPGTWIPSSRFRFSDSGLDPEPLSADPSIPEESSRSADVGWPMNDGGNQVSAGPSAMKFMADHWLDFPPNACIFCRLWYIFYITTTSFSISIKRNGSISEYCNQVWLVPCNQFTSPCDHRPKVCSYFLNIFHAVSVVTTWVWPGQTWTGHLVAWPSWRGSQRSRVAWENSIYGRSCNIKSEDDLLSCPKHCTASSQC